jgi:competence protein ComEA
MGERGTVDEGARLRAMRMRPERSGWVPEDGHLVAPEAVSPSALVAPPSAPVAPPAAGDLVRAWARDRLPLWSHRLVDRCSAGSIMSALTTAAVLVVAAIMLLHHRSAGDGPSYDTASATAAGPSYPAGAASAAPAAPVDASSIVVDVAGRVRKPGLVTLPSGARVADAISAAGGPLRHREIARLDLAAHVSDGQLLLVGMASSAAPGGSTADSSMGGSAPPVALNSATLEQLETLPGIGPVTGQKILDWRTAHGGFTAVVQLQQVSGIGPATYSELSPLVTL